MNILIAIDRDGTLIYDDKYHLGKTNDWKSKVKILPGVIKGLKILNTIPNVGIYTITNQPGVAVKEFKLLTEQRAQQVCDYVSESISKKGGKITGCFVCPHANKEYIKRRPERSYDKKLVCDCNCIKPNLGLVFDALKHKGWTRKNTLVFVVGDRLSDIQTGLNTKGWAIFVPFKGEAQEIAKIKKLKSDRVYMAKNFVDAAEFVKKTAKKHIR